MADALLDKSLDALIAERSTKRPPGGGGAGSKPRSTRGGNRAKAKAAVADGGKPAGKPQAKPAAGAGPRVVTAMRVQGKKIAKPAGGRGRGGSRRAPMFVPAPGMASGYMAPPPGWIPVPAGMLPAPHMVPAIMPAPALLPAPHPGGKPYTYKDPDAADKWRHDMYDGPIPRRRGIAARIRQPQPRAQPQRVVGTKLHVSNLADAVTKDDIKELFGDKGEVIDAELGYDARSGRATGEAWVTYKEKKDAMAAIQAFNGVLLDGLELKIELVKEEVVLQLASGLSLTRHGEAPSRPTQATVGAGRLLGHALSGAGPSQGMGLPRGMGDPAPAPRRGPGPGPRSATVRVRSGVTQRASTDDMQE